MFKSIYQALVPTQPKGTVTGGVRRPNWITRNTKQRVVLVRDASGSMVGQPADDAVEASRQLVKELAKPENKDGFLVSFVDFSDCSEQTLPEVKATDAQNRVPNLWSGGDGSTNITDGLYEALSILTDTQYDQQQECTFLRPVVLVFTDGGHNRGFEPHQVASELRKVADLVTVAFGPGADESLMIQLATSPQHFYRCQSGVELRAFLASVGATLTQNLVTKQSATRALATIQQ